MFTGRCRDESWGPTNPHRATFNHQRTEQRCVNSLAVLFLWDSPVPRFWGFVESKSLYCWQELGKSFRTGPAPPAQDWKISCESHRSGDRRFNASVGERYNASRIHSYLLLTSSEVDLVLTKGGCKRHIRTEHHTSASIRTDPVKAPGRDTKVMLSSCQANGEGF